MRFAPALDNSDCALTFPFRQESPDASADTLLAKTRQKKRQLLDALAELERDLEGLEHAQKREYNANSPLGQLPDEILAIIFFETLDLIRDEQSEKMRAHILSTCHRWLSVGLHSPCIWNRIVVRRGRSARIYTRYPHSYLRAQLARSKSAPLGLWIHPYADRDLKTLFPLVEPHLHRAQILHIHIPMGRGTILDLPSIYASLPNCRDLSIYSSPDRVSLSNLLPTSSHMPKLTALSIGEEQTLRAIAPTPMPTNVNFGGLTHLSLGAYPPQNIMKVLLLCPAVKCLSLRGTQGLDMETGYIGPLTLPHLEHLDVQGPFERYCMGPQFKAPRLESLSLLGQLEQTIQGDPRKFTELRCAHVNPESLSPIRHFAPTFLVEFLHHHPKLECMTLVPSPETTLFAEDDEAPERQTIDPSLYRALMALLKRPADRTTIRWPNFHTLVVRGGHISERSPRYETHLRELIAMVHKIQSVMPQELFVYFPGSVSERFLERVLNLPYNPFIAPQTPEDRDPRWIQRRLFEKNHG